MAQLPSRRSGDLGRPIAPPAGLVESQTWVQVCSTSASEAETTTVQTELGPSRGQYRAFGDLRRVQAGGRLIEHQHTRAGREHSPGAIARSCFIRAVALDLCVDRGGSPRAGGGLAMSSAGVEGGVGERAPLGAQ